MDILHFKMASILNLKGLSAQTIPSFVMDNLIGSNT